MGTYNATAATAENNWYLVDAENKTLGRLASEIARRLRGKHKPTYTPHVDTGDYIIVINVEKIAVTGGKLQKKIYHHHTGYPGGIKSISLEKLIARKPADVLEKAVYGMMPKGPLGRQMFKKLKVYAGAKHPHSAQTPTLLEIKEAS
ncbi:MAG: ribosomal protein [Gammaproteobacteria bacterium]|jgi:large subunit ribosomal protein L13|nr:ribosomal protein [Gammaproteobacteria bacterium]